MNPKIFNFFNLRTFLALAVSQVAVFLAIHFQIKFNVNVMLVGLAIVFPIHFSIQAAFKRRERALEYFSVLKGALISLYQSIHIAEDLTAEKKTEGSNLLQQFAGQLETQLRNCEGGYEPIQQKLNDIFAFVAKHKKDLEKRNVIRMIRYMNLVSESSVYLVSLITHRTMAGLRFYGIFFVIIFPFVQAPILLYRLEHVVPAWILYVGVAFTSIILISLTNFQKMIEYPFDQRGIDNVQLKDFVLGI